MATQRLAVVVCLLNIHGLSIAANAAIKGIPIEKASFYNPEQDFTCLDGSNRIPFSMVNDDYCDCLDGSDEPGTPACTNGKYYCLNRGHVGKEVVSSRVNDGICDCCDGSDEYDSGATCANTCTEMGRKMQEKQQEMRASQEAGYRTKQEYSNAGLQTKKEKEETLARLKVEKETQELEVKTLREAKEEAEGPEKVAKEEHDQKVQKKREEREAENNKKVAADIFMKLDVNHDVLITEDELQSYVELDLDGDGTVSKDEISQIVGSTDSLSFDNFVGGAYSLLAEKVDFTPLLVGSNDDGEESDDEQDDGEDLEEDQPSGSDDSVEMPYDETTQQLIDAANKARQLYEEAERKESEIDSSISEVTKYLDIDMGEAEEFAKMHGQCYEFTDREYVYKLCPFDKVTQRSKSGGRETSLGTWDSWSGGVNSRYRSMKYANGEHCWNGPNRSTLVTLKCGAREELVSASEPNRCEYAMDLLTPAVCEPYDPNKHFVHEEL